MKNQALTSAGTSFPWLFFILTFGLTWLFWIPLALSGRKAGLPALAIGGFSPTLIGIVMTYLTQSSAGRRDFWKRVIDFRLVGGKWYAVILSIFPLTIAFTFLLDILMGGILPAHEGAIQTLTHPGSLIVFIIVMLLGGPLAEELGWRGYALDRLQMKRNALVSSLILGIIWGLWHLPLFFIEGTSQREMGVGTVLFWMFIIQVVAMAILFTWVYNNNQRSILSAILLHFMSNSTFTLIARLGHALPQRTEIIRTAVYVIAVVIVVVFWGPKTMTRKQEEAEMDRN